MVYICTMQHLNLQIKCKFFIAFKVFMLLQIFYYCSSSTFVIFLLLWFFWKKVGFEGFFVVVKVLLVSWFFCCFKALLLMWFYSMHYTLVCCVMYFCGFIVLLCNFYLCRTMQLLWTLVCLDFLFKDASLSKSSPIFNFKYVYTFCNLSDGILLLLILMWLLVVEVKFNPNINLPPQKVSKLSLMCLWFIHIQILL